jgi:hypothetical protein
MTDQDEDDEIGPGPLDPGITRARFQKIVDDLRRLKHRWGADLDEVLPFFEMHLTEAQGRLARSRKARVGAPNFWTQRNLNDLWHAVEGWRRLHDWTVEAACAHLAKLGYSISVTDCSGPVERNFEKTIRSGQALRIAFYEADRLRKSSIPGRVRKPL